MSKRIKRKQPALAAFGFTKKFKRRGEEIAFQMPLEAVETFFECENCEKPFKAYKDLLFTPTLCTVLFLKKIVKLQSRQESKVTHSLSVYQ